MPVVVIAVTSHLHPSRAISTHLLILQSHHRRQRGNIFHTGPTTATEILLLSRMRITHLLIPNLQ